MLLSESIAFKLTLKTWKAPYRQAPEMPESKPWPERFPVVEGIGFDVLCLKPTIYLGSRSWNSLFLLGP